MILSKAKASEAAEAIQVLIDELRKQGFPTPAVQVFFLSLRGTLYIHLHNSGGVRPTVYLIKTESASTSVRMLRFSVETMDCDSTTGHKVLRKSGSLEFMKGVLSELVKQPASGSLEETKLTFSLSGLLNWGYRQDIELD